MLNRNQFHDYQVEALNFAKSNDKCALWLSMGEGKSITSLTYGADLLNSLDVTKILVIAPLRVANTVWHIEASKWEHTKDLTFSICTGSKQDRLAALSRDADFYVINRENIPWLVEHYKAKWPFDCVILDESSSFKSNRSQRWKSLRKVSKYITRMVQLTGTPSPQGYLDIWPQVFLLDGGQRLGKTMGAFKDRFFDSDYMGYSVTIKQGAEDRINELIKDVVYRSNAPLHSERVDLVRYAELSSSLTKQYKQLEKDFIVQLQDSEIAAFSAAALTNKLLQFANGNVYNEDGETVNVHSAKIDVLKEIVEEAQGEPVLVGYNFKSDLADLQKAFPNAEVLGKEYEQIARWNEGKISMLLAHPASAGHGIQLERGSSILVWYGLNWSLELYQQFVARLDRQGQKKKVRNIRIVTQGTVDEKVIDALEGKAITQERLLDFIKSVYSIKNNN